MSPDDLVPARPAGNTLATYDPELRRRTRENAQAAVAEPTRKVYARDWARFLGFCRSAGFIGMPADPEAICAHLNDLAERGSKIGTLRRVYTSIRATHTHAGHRLPLLDVVQNTLSNLARQRGDRTRQAAPFSVDDLRAYVAKETDDVRGRRNRALALLGFAAALRRSELVALEIRDLEFVSDGLRVVIARSKTDQEGEGVAVGVNFGEGPLCPVEAVRAWLAELETRGVAAGPAFRAIDRFDRVGTEGLSDKAITHLAKRVAAIAGRNPVRYSGHSFRAGLATSAARAGKDLVEIMKTTRHESERVAKGYIREGELFTRAANRGLMK